MGTNRLLDKNCECIWSSVAVENLRHVLQLFTAWRLIREEILKNLWKMFVKLHQIFENFISFVKIVTINFMQKLVLKVDTVFGSSFCYVFMFILWLSHIPLSLVIFYIICWLKSIASSSVISYRWWSGPTIWMHKEPRGGQKIALFLASLSLNPRFLLFYS